MFNQNITSDQLHFEIPVKEVLLQEPFSYEFDDLVVARVRAYNSRGWSEYSDSNTVGVRIQTEPRTMSTPQRGNSTCPEMIAVSWQPISAPDNGNSAVLSYSLEYDAGTNGESWEPIMGYLTSYEQLSVNVTQKITLGNTYMFKLRAQNIWGWGAYS